MLCQVAAVPVLRKDPQTWLRLCQNRANALGKKFAQEKDVEPKTQEQLLAAGLTAAQAAYYLRSYSQAKARREWLRTWDASMPPTIWQTFGIRHAPRAGVRIPLPPMSRPIPTLPACAPEVLDMDALDLTWLRQCNPHLRDERINFVTEGHKYYIDGEPVDVSVTGYVACFSEAWGLGLGK